MKKATITVHAMNALVIAEATKLKKNATPEEIADLDFEYLHPSQLDLCVYGQMTGNCFSDRAAELIKLSCKQIFDHNINRKEADAKMGDTYGKLNGKPLDDRSSYWSPIEVFICMPRNQKNGNNKRLIDYLKGETKKLTLK